MTEAGAPHPSLARRGLDGLDPRREPRDATLVADAAVLRAWRTGPRWYHVVVATIDDPRVEQRRRVVADALADLVLRSTPGQAHVTLWAAGFAAEPVLPATRVLALSIGSPATFASAVYLTVGGDPVASVRAELAAANPPEDRADVFTPHVTVGVFRAAVPVAHVQQRLAALAQPPVDVTARIERLVVDTRTDRLCPPPL